MRYAQDSIYLRQLHYSTEYVYWLLPRYAYGLSWATLRCITASVGPTVGTERTASAIVSLAKSIGTPRHSVQTIGSRWQDRLNDCRRTQRCARPSEHRVLRELSHQPASTMPLDRRSIDRADPDAE